MSQYCVVVAEGSRARFFTVEPAELPELESGPNLVERKSLTNPEHQAHDDEVFAETRAGRNRSNGGAAHGYDDHRAGHDAEMERRFARDIARELDEIARGNGTQRIVLCAEKRMLGYLRPPLQNTIASNIQLTEIAKDLAKLTPGQIQKKLAQEGHIPPCKPRAGI
ncbi:protein required for attachment to host cells [Natronocella acetinitrilica]|uniref:Protein required for attachment to host cells n=1 Tax=Natronocella acetinitrilica TaxID=414046 RepID=A0AAE3G280_9GAMM|nr:host attachment protein [Natronocella acetinitrilica]MCP1673093.1 protein required for attachment to host cells [Natronocella acetinitrilica]